MGVGQVLTMPMFFASNAIYPLGLMPEWLQVIAKINPLTYLVDALRGLMIEGGQGLYGLREDLSILAVIFLVLLAAAVKLYPTLVR